MQKPDLIIVGGGIIGLSIADCALREGLRVAVLDKGPLGQEASWAGAGMITCRPMPRRHAGVDYHDLCLLSLRLYPKWAERLREETGIDSGFRVNGALEIFLPQNETPALKEEMQTLVSAAAERGLRARVLDSAEICRFEPHLRRDVVGAVEYFDEAQIRNPRFVRALIASVKQKGADIRENCAVKDVILEGSRVLGVELSSGKRLEGGAVIISAGSWSSQFSAVVKLAPAVGKIAPVRGQILCYQTQPPFPERIITADHHYVVPRGDGVLLVGSTSEKVGYDKSTTEDGLQLLKNFANELLPALKNLEPAKTWAGLRPGLKGKHPIIGPVPEVSNLWIASGHFRNGLTQAPATAELLISIILKRNAQMSVENWYPARVLRSGR